ncbi:MAG: efflux RND transporter periplasmic adaptor subunit [Deltaproteobacteria bacterium]|nr:efflux RND transporter periplasmic adaptor subunit [Deltaproteobacteria bacterium]
MLSMDERGGIRRGALLALAGVVALACGEEPPPPEPVVRPVKIVEIGGAGSGRTVELPGQIQAGQRADLGFEVAGRIIELPVSEGQRVAKGTVIGRIDPRDYQAQLDSANAKLRQTKADYQRRKELYDRDVISKSELELRQRTYEVAKAGVAEAMKAVEDTKLVAPFDGTVARKLKEERENVQAKEPVVRFQNASQLELVVAVPERTMAAAGDLTDLDSITRRVRPQVEVSSLPGRRFPARFTEVATVADPVTRTFAVTVTFDPPDDAQVMAGMTARVVVTQAEANGYVLPVSAVLGDAEKEAFVWLVDRDSMAVSAQVVELGDLTGSDVEIRSGLEPGQWVAVSGVRKLRPGMVVSRLEK